MSRVQPTSPNPPSPPHWHGRSPIACGQHGRRRRRVVVDLHLLDLHWLGVAESAAACALKVRACLLRVHAGMESDDHSIMLKGEPVVAVRFGPPHLSGARDSPPLAKNIGLERAVRGGATAPLDIPPVQLYVTSSKKYPHR